MAAVVQETRSDKIFNFSVYAILTIIFLAVIYPLIYVVSASFSSPVAVLSGRVFLWPVQPGFEGYRAVFQSQQIWRAYGNTIFYTGFGTMINIALTVMAAYPLSRRDLVGRNFVMFFYSFTMFFGGGIIPLYLLVRSLGMVNTRWAMLIPNAMAVWNVILTRTYFQSSIPHELLESSQIDGCSNSRFVWSIVLPLSKPIVAVISLFYGVMHWNTFFHALIFLKDSDLYPLQIVLREILIQNQMDNTMMMYIEQQQHREMLAALLKYSLIIVASVPVLLIYPFVQKYFVKGVMIGAIKG